MGAVRPCMGYSSHIWGGSKRKALLGKVESRAFRLINSCSYSLQSLSSHRIVESLYTIVAIITDIALLNSHVSYLLH